jgi:hypothetical protein
MMLTIQKARLNVPIVAHIPCRGCASVSCAKILPFVKEVLPVKRGEYKQSRRFTKPYFQIHVASCGREIRRGSHSFGVSKIVDDRLVQNV